MMQYKINYQGDHPHKLMETIVACWEKVLN
jgi:hypothetical protein